LFTTGSDTKDLETLDERILKALVEQRRESARGEAADEAMVAEPVRCGGLDVDDGEPR
jgi:hypothetical protein